MQKANFNVSCKNCGMNTICLPAMLVESEVAHLDSIIQRNTKSIDKGTHLYYTSNKFRNLYAVRSGAFKSYITSYSGEEQITAFHLPGDIIGFDAINTGKHNSSAVALMNSQTCKIPYGMLGKISNDIKVLNNQMMRLLSKEITDDQELLLLLGQKQANEKIASLLINFSYRNKARNLPDDLLTLPMSRGDLANYLGLTIETVCRVLKVFKDKQLIKTNGKQVYLKDINALKYMAGIDCECPIIDDRVRTSPQAQANYS